MDARISITAEEIFGSAEEFTAVDFDGVHVGLAGEDRANGLEESGATHRCSRCNASLAEYPDGFHAIDNPSHLAEAVECEENTEDYETFGPHEAEPIGGSFANSASVSLDLDDDAVTVSISVGDPRGAFTMSVRRVDGELYLYVPYAGEPAPHMNLTHIQGGTFKIGD